MLDINLVPLTKDGNTIDYWGKFVLVDEKIECHFIENGEVMHKVHNVISHFGFSRIGMIVYLDDNNNAEKEIREIIKSANKSKCSPLTDLKVLHGEYHER